jgi:hypothetical protein
VDIYVYMQGQRRGPYEKEQLEAMWKRGQIPTPTLYWHDGMSKWAVISDLFADTAMPNMTSISAHPDSGSYESGTHPNT